ncbi:hypothetical protein BC830DRAFT_1078836 [Chytriomyces sp. MP71]|nr:hypothetical protein BC830DRAFT_1078836 [Chytriomyces sp. MP71]
MNASLFVHALSSPVPTALAVTATTNSAVPNQKGTAKKNKSSGTAPQHQPQQPLQPPQTPSLVSKTANQEFATLSTLVQQGQHGQRTPNPKKKKAAQPATARQDSSASVDLTVQGSNPTQPATSNAGAPSAALNKPSKRQSKNAETLAPTGTPAQSSSSTLNPAEPSFSSTSFKFNFEDSTMSEPPPPSTDKRGGRSNHKNTRRDPSNTTGGAVGEAAVSRVAAGDAAAFLQHLSSTPAPPTPSDRSLSGGTPLRNAGGARGGRGGGRGTGREGAYVARDSPLGESGGSGPNEPNWRAGGGAGGVHGKRLFEPRHPSSPAGSAMGGGTPQRFGGAGARGSPNGRGNAVGRANVFEELSIGPAVFASGVACSDALTPTILLEMSAMEGLTNKTLLEGPLRINRRSFFDAYVTVEGLPDDVYIPGKYKRNRAFDGDVVVVQILSGEELERELKREEGEGLRKKEMEGERRRKVVLEEDAGRVAIEEEDDVLKEVRIYGKVVFIKDKKEAHMVIGTLHVDNPSSKGPSRVTPGLPVDSSINTIWFRPHDQRVPFVVVPVEHVPLEFLKEPYNFPTTLWRLSITKWPAHCQYPYGKVGGMMGLMGEIPVETESLLLENGITWSDFAEEVLTCLPPTPWSIPESEYAVRRDFRNVRVFSIDPLTARDLDDALSVVPLPDGTFEVGVHIADVSHFVRAGTALDAEAQNRSTTVYLIQKAIPMLPRLLCEELCSLNPGVERLAFSVTWILDKNAVLLREPWFGKSVIRSCAKLSYDHAQALIEGKGWEGLPPVQLDGEHTLEQIRADTLLLYGMSVKMRERRYEGGALSINSFKLWFSLDGSGNPIHTGVYELKDSNRMIEEFMLMANMAVAKKISDVFPESAMLRRHEPPKPRPLKQFLEFASEIGYPMDASTSQTFQASFNEIEKPEVEDVLRQLAIKPMQRAKYFCTGLLQVSQWIHYALNVPLYTHFTSPIRRYCDLVVHRQLQAALEAEAVQQAAGAGAPFLAIEPHSMGDVGVFARTCNERKFSSKDAQDASQRLYLSVYLNTLASNPTDGIPLTGLERVFGGKCVRGVVAEALVYRVMDRSFDVIVERYGLEKRVWIEDGEGMLGCAFEKDKKVLTVYWRGEGKNGKVGVDGVVDAFGALEIGGKAASSAPAEAIVVEDVDGDNDGWETDEGDEGASNKRNGKKPPVASDIASSSHEHATPTGKGRRCNKNGGGFDGQPNGGTPRSQKKRSEMDPSTTISQNIRIFDKIPVVVVADISRSPPEIKLYLVHPEVVAAHKYKLEEGIKVISYDSQSNFSCPAIDDEAH